jgi:uncharacterized membrane protein YjjP (DUF1212 family)
MSPTDAALLPFALPEPEPDLLTPEIELCTEVARTLHHYGTSAFRLEQRMASLSRALGVPGDFFVTPTAVLASYRLPGKHRPHTQLMRAEPGTTDLGRLSDVDALIDALLAGSVLPEEAHERLAEINERDTTPSAVRAALAASAISAAAACFLGGGYADAAFAGLLGLSIALLERATAKHQNAGRLVPPAIAALAGAASIVAAGHVSGLSVATAQLAAVILLVPGFEFTLAIKEIATANLVAGAARITAAFGEFLALGFGLAIGTRLATDLVGAPAMNEPVPMAGWVVPLALAAASVGFAWRFRAHGRDALWVAAACLLGYAGAWLGGSLLGDPLDAFIGAMVVGVASNLFARRLGRSPLVMMVPGIILLVPGSVGFRSFAMLLRHDVLSGIETAFAMVLTATALSTGLLFANLVLPSERARATDAAT